MCQLFKITKLCVVNHCSLVLTGVHIYEFNNKASLCDLLGDTQQDTGGYDRRYQCERDPSR